MVCRNFVMQFLLNSKFILLTLLISSCSSSNNIDIRTKYLINVGDISKDQILDDQDFTVCDEKKIVQYFNFSLGLQFNGEMKRIQEIFKEKFRFNDLKNEDGLIRIRFVVNCKGKTGRFRIMAMDNKYHPKEFDKFITDQLLQITRDLKGWKPQYYHKIPIDYYQYLIFKIKGGRIIEILP